MGLDHEKSCRIGKGKVHDTDTARATRNQKLGLELGFRALTCKEADNLGHEAHERQGEESDAHHHAT